MDRLQQMFQKQLDLQIENMGFDPRDLTPEGRKALFLEMSYALVDELHEAGNELSWKSWAKAEFFNRQAYGKELIDAWHFYMVLFLMRYPPGTPTSVIAQEFFEEYIEKHAVNVKRQEDGYTGVKCPSCHRDPGDEGCEALEYNAIRCACGITYNALNGEYIR